MKRLVLLLAMVVVPLWVFSQCNLVNAYKQSKLNSGTVLYTGMDIGLRSTFTPPEDGVALINKGIEPFIGINHRIQNHSTYVQLGFNDGKFGGELGYLYLLPLENNFYAFPGISYRNGYRYNDNKEEERKGRASFITGICYIAWRLEVSLQMKYNIGQKEYFPSMKIVIPLLHR